MRPLQAHCHCGLSALYATAGRWEQARAALSVAIELSHAMDMTFWLPLAERRAAGERGRSCRANIAERRSPSASTLYLSWNHRCSGLLRG